MHRLTNFINIRSYKIKIHNGVEQDEYLFHTMWVDLSSKSTNTRVFGLFIFPRFFTDRLFPLGKKCTHVAFCFFPHVKEKCSAATFIFLAFRSSK